MKTDKEKTAMQELIDLLKQTRDLHQNKFSYSEFNYCVIHAEKHLEKEKQQHEAIIKQTLDTCDSPHKGSLSEYFSETIELALNKVK